MLSLRKKILDLFENEGHRKSPEAEADLILFHSLRLKYPALRKISEIYSPPPGWRMTLTPEIEETALNMAQERIKGIPLQHITQNQFFFEHDYAVNAHVLIPRPETEILISELIRHAKATWQNKPFRFAELGLGSGILSAEILFNFKASVGLASEMSPQAIAIARDNLDRVLGSGTWEHRFSIIEPAEPHVGFEIFEDYQPMDLIVSNPPYVSVNDEIEDEVLRYEPHTALFPMLGGLNVEKENPDFFYENFLHHHARILKPSGVAFFEVPHERAKILEDEFKKAGFTTALIDDLTGRPRVLRVSDYFHRSSARY